MKQITLQNTEITYRCEPLLRIFSKSKGVGVEPQHQRYQVFFRFPIIKKTNFRKLVKSLKLFLEKILEQIIEQITDKCLATWNYYALNIHCNRRLQNVINMDLDEAFGKSLIMWSRQRTQVVQFTTKLLSLLSQENSLLYNEY